MKEKLNKLEVLLSRFYSELEERGYAKSSFYMYRAAGARLIKWCDKHSITDYNEDVGKRFCEYVDAFYKGQRNDKWRQDFLTHCKREMILNIEGQISHIILETRPCN